MYGEKRIAKPAIEGAIVPFPGRPLSHPLAADGEEVVVNTWWAKRTRDGSVVLEALPVPDATAPAAEPETESKVAEAVSPDAPKKTRRAAAEGREG